MNYVYDENTFLTVYNRKRYWNLLSDWSCLNYGIRLKNNRCKWNPHEILSTRTRKYVLFSVNFVIDIISKQSYDFSRSWRRAILIIFEKPTCAINSKLNSKLYDTYTIIKFTVQENPNHLFHDLFTRGWKIQRGENQQSHEHCIHKLR